MGIQNTIFDSLCWEIARRMAVQCDGDDAACVRRMLAQAPNFKSEALKKVADLAPRRGESDCTLRQKRRGRSRLFGIEEREADRAYLTFRRGYPKRLLLYADPVNLKYPVNDAKHARLARVRFVQHANRYKSKLSRQLIHENIVRAELELGISPGYDPKARPLDRLLLPETVARMEKAS